MKTTSIIVGIMSLFFFIVGLCPVVSMAQVLTPPAPAWEENNFDQMPARFPLLASPEEFKASVLRRARYGGLTIQGPVSFMTGQGHSLVIGDSPYDIIEKMALLDYRLLMPNLNEALDVTAELFDEDAVQLAYGYASVYPEWKNGTYVITHNITIEVGEWQKLEGVSGDIVSAKMFNAGFETLNLPVIGNEVILPISRLGKRGYLMIVRLEPTSNGQTREVTYGYSLLTGSSVSMTEVRQKLTMSINNYIQLTDVREPQSIGGVPVSLRVDMRLSKRPIFNGTFISESQPVARVEITVPNRTLEIWTGLINQKSGFVHEYGYDLRAVNRDTGVTYYYTATSGYLKTQPLPVGSYDIMYHITALDPQSPKG